MFTSTALENRTKRPLIQWERGGKSIHSTKKTKTETSEIRLPIWLIRLVRYEYWPFWLFYLPMAPCWVWQAIKSKSLTWFTATNQNIEMGGFFGESKMDILRQIGPQYKAKSFFVEKGTSFPKLLSIIENEEFTFPIILKPNVGERGFEVEKIDNVDGLKAYHVKGCQDFIIQQFVDEPIELGVLFVRFPGEPFGQVTSVTQKEFMEVIGDGKSTILQLMEQKERFRLQIENTAKTLGNGINEILFLGEKRLLEPIGNHCRGTRFINANHLINNDLHIIFNKITKAMPGLYFGRFDLKVRSLDDLYHGKNIFILELNGASSEPGHVYDTRHGLWNAYRDLRWHWNALGCIARLNMKSGIKPASVSEVVRVLKTHFTTTTSSKTYKVLKTL